jgi:hypothetical protein
LLGANLPEVHDDVLNVRDEFSEQAAAAKMMYASAVPKRGSFFIWNADGTGQNANKRILRIAVLDKLIRRVMCALRK